MKCRLGMTALVLGGVLLSPTGCGGGESSSATDAQIVDAQTSDVQVAMEPNDFTPPTGKPSTIVPESPGEFRLLWATSTDGIQFTRTGQIISDQANVPQAVVDENGKIFLYYVGWTVGAAENVTAVAISNDDGAHWSYRTVTFDAGENIHQSDPDIIWLGPSQFRGYFTTGIGGRHAILYTNSTNGRHFSKGGVAFDRNPADSLDSVTFQLGGQYHMYTLNGTSIQMAYGTSSDGLIFQPQSVSSIRMGSKEYVLSDGLPTAGGYRVWGFSLMPSEIRAFTTTDGSTFTPEATASLTFDSNVAIESRHIKDPTVVRLRDGTYGMAYATKMP